jgi:MFS family permease
MQEVACKEALQRNISALNRHAALNNLVLMLTVQAEIQLCTVIFAADVGRCARFLSTTASAVGLFEFCVNPSIGKLSDRFGRKMFLLMGCSWAVVGNTLVALNPTSLPLVAVNRCLTWSLITLSGSVTGGAAIADCSDAGGDLAINLSRFFSMFGIGVVVGPLVGGVILSRTGSPRFVYAARAVVAGIELLHDVVTIREPLGLRERLLQLPPPKRPTVTGLVNPFGFLKVFQRRSLGCLVAATWLTATTEAKNTTDVFQLWLGQPQGVGLSVTQARNVTVGYGAVMLLSGKYIAPAMINRLGPRRFTTVSLVTQGLAFGLWGGVRGSLASLLGGLALLLPSINATSSECIHMDSPPLPPPRATVARFRPLRSPIAHTP